MCLILCGHILLIIAEARCDCAILGPSLSRTELACFLFTGTFWLSCCNCYVPPRSGSITAARRTPRRPAPSFQPS